MFVVYAGAGVFSEFMVNLMRGDTESHVNIWMRLGFRLSLLYLSLPDVALQGASLNARARQAGGAEDNSKPASWIIQSSALVLGEQ